MNTSLIIKQTIYRYKSYYILIAIAVIVAVMVVTGSLAVGDSVRNTLIKRVEERLGKTETIIFSRYAFLSDDIIQNFPNICVSENETDIHAVLLVNGFVSISGNLIPVMIWGREDKDIERGHAKINSDLNDLLKTFHPKEIVLRLPSSGMVPIGSMFVTDTYTTSMRLLLDSVISKEKGGNLNLKNEQILPLNIFVNRNELAETMGLFRKINLILSNRTISIEEFSSVWNWEHSGLKVQGDTITSERIFIQNQVMETLCALTGSMESPNHNRYFGYLANSIRKDHLSIPYSFVTAVHSYHGRPLPPDEIILTDYAAQRLNAHVGDTLSVGYFVSKQFKTLLVDSIFLKVGTITPIEEVYLQTLLKTDFPGLSNVERCTDWDSDLPINMNLITDEDEAFWTRYKNTPKAILPYSTMAPKWENVYGNATALQLCKPENKLNRLSPDMFDIQIVYPRQGALVAAKSGVDFSTLFFSLAFFIIISAILLMLVPISEMLWVRRSEIALLKAIGFSKRGIVHLFWRESLLVVVISAVIGVMAGLIYTRLVLFLLGNVWKGATHTQGFELFPNTINIMVGFVVGIMFLLLLLYFYIRKEVFSN